MSNRQETSLRLRTLEKTWWNLDELTIDLCESSSLDFASLRAGYRKLTVEDLFLPCRIEFYAYLEETTSEGEVLGLYRRKLARR